jgi:hypothetical protein
MSFLFRFLIGGLVVCAFASLADTLKPKTFAGLFSAAPSVALATLALTVSQDGRRFAAEEARAMLAGAVGLRRLRVHLPRTHCSLALDTAARGDCFPGCLVRVCGNFLASTAPLNVMRIRFDFAALRRTGPKEYAVRFLFGGTVTLLAGVAAHYYGSSVGGLFLAFPAIFPAGATLIAKHEERRKRQAGLDGRERGRLAAALDARGAVIGACGLFFFAFSVHSLLPVWPAAAALGLATLAWFASSVLIWRLR